MAVLSSPDELPTFLKNFESNMITFEVPKKYWSRKLLPSLDPIFLNFVQRMDNAEDFDHVATELVRLHGLGEEHFRDLWWNFRLKYKKTYAQAERRLAIIVDAWLKQVNDVADMLVKECLTAVMTSDVRNWV